MDKYIQLYNDTFNLKKSDIVKVIKKQLKLSWENDLYFDYAIKTIEKQLQKLRSNFEIEKPIYSKILEDFKKRRHIFANNELKIISYLLIPELEAIDNNKLEPSDFIIQLAIRESFENIFRLLELNRSIIIKQYLLKRLDGYRYMKNFEIIEYSSHPENTLIYYELKGFFTESKKNVNFNVSKNEIKPDNKIILPIYSLQNIQEILNENYFKIKEDYELKLSHKNFYKYLTDDFIDDEQTTYLDFVKVFYLNPEYHRSNIYFHCSTQRASLLLSMLMENIIKELNQKSIENNKMFFSSNDKALSQSNISKSKSPQKQGYSKNFSLISKALDYLEEIPINK